MKKNLLAALLMVGLSFAYQAKAQYGSSKLMTIVAGDTVSTSSSMDTVSKVITATAGYSALGIEVIATKVSGTVTSKAYLYGSLDGSVYNLTDSASAAFANSAGAQSVFFTKTAGLPYTHYRVQVRQPTTAGSSEVVAVAVRYVLKGFDKR